MKKNLLYLLLIISIALSSCSSENESPNMDWNGEWLVYERSIVECSDTVLQKELNAMLLTSMNQDLYEYRLTIDDGYYEELVSKYVGEELVKDKSFIGKYTLSDDRRTMSLILENLAVVNNWSYSMSLLDTNLADVMAVTQTMGGRDLYNLLAVYYGRQRPSLINRDVTAVLKIKAVRMKE